MSEYTKEQIKNNIDRWVAALESGEYKQATNHLHTGDNGFCCLGVACDLFKDELKLDRDKMTHAYNTVFAYNGETGNPPQEVLDYLGLTNEEGAYKDSDGYTGCLVNDNDDKDHDFNMIAETIRSRPKGLFREGI